METAKPKLLFPQLQGFYDWLEPVSWLLIRLTAGLMLLPHGWTKLMAGIGPVAANTLMKRGIQPAEPLAVILIAIETIGGVCIALGLFTRFWAAAATIEMCVVIWAHSQKFAWAERGYEYPLFWTLVLLAIWFRGGGPYSLDRKIGKEL